MLPDDNEIELPDPSEARPVPTTDPDAPLTDLEIQIMIGQVERMGMTNAEATCFVDAFLGIAEGGRDHTWAQDRLRGCGLTEERLTELGVPAG